VKNKFFDAPSFCRSFSIVDYFFAVGMVAFLDEKAPPPTLARRIESRYPKASKISSASSVGARRSHA
jgi:hypothetical protein